MKRILLNIVAFILGIALVAFIGWLGKADFTQRGPDVAMLAVMGSIVGFFFIMFRELANIGD